MYVRKIMRKNIINHFIHSYEPFIDTQSSSPNTYRFICLFEAKSLEKDLTVNTIISSDNYFNEI